MDNDIIDMKNFKIIFCPLDFGSHKSGAAVGATTLTNFTKEILPNAPVIEMKRERGCFSLNSLMQCVRNSSIENIIPFSIGGDHLISCYAIAGVYSVFKNLKVVQFDAHHDAYNEWPISHYSFMRYLQPILSIERHGLRWDKNEVNDTQYNSKDQYIYITIDVDYFSPSLVSSVGHPVKTANFNASSTADFHTALDNLDLPIIGVDICEWYGSESSSEKLFLKEVIAHLVEKINVSN